MLLRFFFTFLSFNGLQVVGQMVEMLHKKAHNVT